MPKIDELQRPVSTESATGAGQSWGGPYSDAPDRSPPHAAPGIAIVVPFRDTVDEDKRSKQLAVFAPHMRAMLSKSASRLRRPRPAP